VADTFDSRDMNEPARIYKDFLARRLRENGASHTRSKPYTIGLTIGTANCLETNTSLHYILVRDLGRSGEAACTDPG
jgi:hypothetical protein